MKPHAWVVATTTVIAVSFAAAGCGGGSSNGGGGVLRIGTHDTTGSLNMFIGGEYASYKKIYPTLAQINVKSGAAIPNFATSWKSSAGGRTWTFRTRPNAKWSDGRPLTAADAAFTFNTIVKFSKGPTAGWASYFNNLTKAETPDPNTLVLTYSKPSSEVVSNTAVDVPILPKHIWGKFAQGDGKRLATFPNQPQNGQPVVSGGPFIATQHRKDAFELFKRNPNAYDAPKVDGVGVKFFANDDAMVTALKSGQLDAIYSAPATAAKTLKSGGFTVAATPTILYDELIINRNPKKPRHRGLLDPKVREALDYAVDRKKIVDVIYLGYAQPGSSIIAPAIGKWHDAGIRPTPFDPDKANQLLDAAGDKRGPGGIRMADGRPMSYQMLIQPDSAREFGLIQSDLRRVGIKLTSRSLDKKAFSAAVGAPDGKYLDFDLALTSGGGGGYDPDFALSGFTCSVRSFATGTGYCNPAYDRLYQQQAAAPEAQRVKLVHQMQRIIAAARPTLILAYQDHIDAWNNKWTGFRQAIDGIYSHTTAGPLTSVQRSG